MVANKIQRTSSSKDTKIMANNQLKATHKILVIDNQNQAVFSFVNLDVQENKETNNNKSGLLVGGGETLVQDPRG